MRLILSLVPLACATLSVVAQSPSPELGKLPAALERIDAEELLRHAAFLASDELGGRMTASPGQAAAAEYIAAHFAKLGFEPLGDEDDQGGREFLQRYPVRRVRIADATRLVIGEEEFAAGFAVLPPQRPAVTISVDGGFVFEGLRPSRSKESLDDRIPVLLVKEPKLRTNKVELQIGASFATLSRLRGYTRRFAARGAKAMVMCLLDDSGGLSNALNYLGVVPGKPLLSKEGASDGGMPTLGASLPVVFTSARVSHALLASMGLEDADLEALVGRDRDARDTAIAKARPAPGAVRGQIIEDDAVATNVVAVLRGTDPELAEQAVLYSAHMDHMGTRMDGQVFNGADDNASGTSGLLTIASAWAGEKPRRSVIFVAVSGEELGLWGSKHFVDHPTWPLEQVVAGINTDMIGRSGPESGPTEVTVTPSYRHHKFSTLVRDSAQRAVQLGLSFTNGDKYYARSDHYNFARAGIPVVFFCNGEHADYHQVTDTADKLDGEKMQSIARLAFWTGWEAARASARPTTLGRSEGWLDDSGK